MPLVASASHAHDDVAAVDAVREESDVEEGSVYKKEALVWMGC
jgi:hypothetical protein